MSPNSKVAVVAVGGNALILDTKHEDVASQIKAVEETCKHIADMIQSGWNVIVSHGNGPQSVVYDQAENRLHAQKAVMALTM